MVGYEWYHDLTPGIREKLVTHGGFQASTNWGQRNWMRVPEEVL